MAEVRLVNRFTGSVAVVPEEKAAGLATLGFEAEESTKSTAKKTTTKKASSSRKSSK
jgi:hypothetical protein